MGTEQYRTGTVSVTTASQIVLGDGTDWANEVEAGQIFKVDLDNESTYSIAQVYTATRLGLSANYLGSTNSGIDYMICRSFSANRSYWRPRQGDYDWAEILSEQTIDKIDTDIANFQSGYSDPPETKTDDYNITTADFAKSLRMNSTLPVWFRVPEVDSNSDGCRITLSKINSGRLTIFVGHGYKIRNSAPGGCVYCNLATQLHANMTLEYVAETKRYIDVGHDGTWVTQDPSTVTVGLDALIQEIIAQTANLDACVQGTVTQTTGIDAWIGTFEETGLDAVLIAS